MSVSNDIWDRVFEKNPDIMTRKVADETLLVPVRGELSGMQRLFMLNRVAEFVWKKLEGETTLAEIRDAVLERFEADPADVRQDMVELVEKLSDLGLISEKAGN